MNGEFACVGFWRRVIAYLVDSLLVGAMVVMVVMFLFLFGESMTEELAERPGVLPRVMEAAAWLLGMLLDPIYAIGFWIYKSATPGKMVISAVIVDAKTGGKPSTGQCIGRYFACILSAIPLYLGFLWVAFDKRKQGWHDKLAGTLVVVAREPES